jgi:hypothetical protein
MQYVVSHEHIQQQVRYHVEYLKSARWPRHIQYVSHNRWSEIIAAVNLARGSDVKAIHLYKEIAISMAERAWARRERALAMSRFQVGAQLCFEFGEVDRGMCLLNKVEAVRSYREKRLEYKGDYESYFADLQRKLSNAYQDEGNMPRALELLRQLVATAKTIGDTDLRLAYKIQLAEIENVFKGKGTRSITINKIMRERFIDALKRATLRAGLSFRLSTAEQARILAPLCLHLQVIPVNISL